MVDCIVVVWIECELGEELASCVSCLCRFYESICSYSNKKMKFISGLYYVVSEVLVCGLE